MEFLDELLRLVASLNDHEVAYVIIGGAAMNAHGLVRATEDVDLFIEPTAENVDRLKNALRQVWDDPSIDEISAAELCGDYPAVRYGPPSGTLYLDILTKLGEFASYDQLETQEIVLRDVTLMVATPRTLHWLKRGTVRPLDHADAAALVEAFDFAPKEE